MHQRRGENRTRSTRGTGRYRVGLNKHHVALGSLLFGLQRCPQSGKAATDDQQVGVNVLRECGRGLRSIGIVQPKGEKARPLQRTRRF